MVAAASMPGPLSTIAIAASDISRGFGGSMSSACSVVVIAVYPFRRVARGKADLRAIPANQPEGCLRAVKQALLGHGLLVRVLAGPLSIAE